MVGVVKNKKRCGIRIEFVSERRIYFVAEGSKGDNYNVTYSKFKKLWTCTCLGYVHMFDCYHIESAKEFLEGLDGSNCKCEIIS